MRRLVNKKLGNRKVLMEEFKVYTHSSHKLCQVLSAVMAKRRFFYVVLLQLFMVLPVAAQSGAFGIGVMLGSPTGISAKKWLSRRTAFDAGAAWFLEDDPLLHLHADYLFHRSDLDGLVEGRSYAYYGIGGRIKLENEDPLFGVRIPFGVTYLFPDAPFDAFFELVPVFDLIPRTQIDLNASIGVRFYFKSFAVR